MAARVVYAGRKRGWLISSLAVFVVVVVFLLLWNDRTRQAIFRRAADAVPAARESGPAPGAATEYDGPTRERETPYHFPNRARDTGEP
jgi:hypothetical protein